MKPTRLILIPNLGNEPAPYLVIEDGLVRERGLLPLDPVERPEPMRTVAVAPGADVTIRWLDLPAGGLAQQRAAAAWMLKESLATAPERLAVVLGPARQPGASRMVALVDLALLQAWVDYLDAVGVSADAIVPDVLTIPEPAEEDRLVAVAFGPSMALRGREFAASVQPELIDLVAGSRRVEPIEDPAEVEAAFIATAWSPAINLLSARERAAGGSRRGWALAAALAGVLMMSPLVLVAAAAARDESRARADAEQVRTEIARVAPDLGAQPRAAEALRRRALGSPPPGGVVGATAALFGAVEAVEGAEIDILTMDPGRGMKATVTHPDFQDIQAMTVSMRERGLQLTETSTLEDQGRIVSDITIGGAR